MLALSELRSESVLAHARVTGCHVWAANGRGGPRLYLDHHDDQITVRTATTTATRSTGPPTATAKKTLNHVGNGSEVVCRPLWARRLWAAYMASIRRLSMTGPLGARGTMHPGGPYADCSTRGNASPQRHRPIASRRRQTSLVVSGPREHRRPPSSRTRVRSEACHHEAHARIVLDDTREARLRERAAELRAEAARVRRQAERLTRASLSLNRCWL